MKKERNDLIVQKRDGGMTLKAIGVELGITQERVRQIYYATKRRGQTTLDGTIGDLDTRTYNCLKNYGLTDAATKDDVRALLSEIRAGFKCGSDRSIRNFGKKSLQALERWLAS